MPPNVRNKGDDPSEYEPEEDVESIGNKKKVGIASTYWCMSDPVAAMS